MEVLILEKNQQQARAIEEILFVEFGFKAAIANSLAHAYKLISLYKYEVFFFDVIYYRTDGVFFFSKLEKNQIPKGIVITSVGCDDINNLICDMCLVAGFEFAISPNKHIDTQTIELAISTALSKKRRIGSHGKSVLNYLTKEDVKDGLEKGYFLNYYQPQYCTVTNKLVSVEALIRFQHPNLGVLGPVSFMRCFDVNELFWFVLERSLKDMRVLKQEISLSVNINQRTLKTPISEGIISLCNSHMFDPSRLTLELTEDEAFDPDVVSLANLTALRLAGVGLAIDDFGTGHSSLSQLVTLPYTELKIDQQFVSSLIKNYKSRQVLATSLFLAKSLKMKSVAEGVEDQETLSYISSVGVELYQGYFGSKPIPIEELKTL